MRQPALRPHGEPLVCAAYARRFFGGGAAALAAGMVALEFGSDLFGSVRVPAHFCGIFGHQPSVGVLPTRGHDFPGTHRSRATSRQ